MSGPGAVPKEGPPGNSDDGRYSWYTGAPLTADGDPMTIPTQRGTYNPLTTPYQAPTYALTPQSGYTGLAQQLQQAFGLSPTAMTTPRNSLQDMYASPWSMLYGGPATPTFAQYFGQPPGTGGV